MTKERLEGFAEGLGLSLYDWKERGRSGRYRTTNYIISVIGGQTLYSYCKNLCEVELYLKGYKAMMERVVKKVEGEQS